MSLKFSKVRALVTVQDGGRWNSQSIGVPISGAMDADALFQAHALVGNASSKAALEIGIGDVEAKITETSLIAISGNAHQLFIDDIAIPSNKAILVADGSVIKFKPRAYGMWSYLAIGGGVDIPMVLGSRSTYLQASFGGLSGRALAVGDVIQSGKKSSLTASIIKSQAGRSVANWGVAHEAKPKTELIRVFPGAEWRWLPKQAQRQLTGQAFVISNESSRMGYRLSGDPISRNVTDEMISSGVTKGTVQLTNEGSLIVLMADGQTVGGYPRIAQVAAVDISILAQKRPNETIRFSLIPSEEAEQLLLNREQEKRQIIESIKLKFA